MSPIAPNKTFNNGYSFNRPSVNQASTYSARRGPVRRGEPARQSTGAMNMTQPQAAMTPSITSSYQRITGGTPTISVSNPGSNFKSKTEVALENYAAEKAVEDQRFKDAFIKQYGEAGYEGFLEGRKAFEDQQRSKRDLAKKMGPISGYQRGIAQANEEKAMSEKAENLRYGYQVGRSGFNYPS
jgi:hypothetical protein